MIAFPFLGCTQTMNQPEKAQKKKTLLRGTQRHAKRTNTIYILVQQILIIVE